MTRSNRQIHLVSRPRVEAAADNFAMVDATIDEPGANHVLVRNHFLSLDPYMRGRMNEGKSYAPPQPLNQVMQGATGGEVVASAHEKYAVGDKVVALGGWQEYVLVDGDAPSLRKVDTKGVPLSAYLGAVGMPGVTAWYGLNKICRPVPGQTVVVTAASGAVGSVVGQLAKRVGCRAVGIAGGAEKCAYVVQELGFDACVDYKAHDDAESLRQALQVEVPHGIDCYFENVGGWILNVVLDLMNPFGRIALCGMISGYNGAPTPLHQPALILRSRLTVEGFIIGERPEIWPIALQELGPLVASGELKYRETVARGLEAAPGALLGLLKGSNFGKQLVQLT